MSETLSQDPDLNTGYTNLAPSYPPTPATPSSTVQDGPPGTHLPPFSTFSTEMDSNASLFSDTRLLDISNWDYYTAEGRLLDRENGLSIISSQPQYRPWESKSVDSSAGFTPTTPVNTFADAFQPNGVSKLPSFQSQFQSFSEPTSTEPTLTTLTNLTPVSPNSSPGHFHTLSAVNPRGYPLVPAPIQAREIPSIQQQFLDERHIQLYTHPSTIFPQNGTIIQNTPLISSPTVVTVLKSEPELKLVQDPIKMIHPTQFQNPIMATDNGIYNGLDKKLNGINATMGSPTRNDFRKKERRKMRASSLESSAESDGASSNMDLAAESSGQVAAVSSTAGFKTHQMANSVEMDEISGNPDKQVKKKRKRCGECIGCQRKDNCGDCAPCRNDKSHQICKQRRCEKLTEKKNLYGDASYLRGESRRGRGKGRGAGSYRGRKPSGPIATVPSGPPSGVSEPNGNITIITQQTAPARPSPQPPTTVHMIKQEQQTLPVQQQTPMTPMPFYADPNRFPTPVWQAADPTQGWTQGQFIQQIPAEGYQQYPNGIYQTTYQQPAFETNTFYTGAVQVLTNTRPPSAPNQQAQQLTPRPNSNYSHTPSPAPQAAPRTQYQEYQNQNFVSPASTPSGNPEPTSRPSSVNSNNGQSFSSSGNNFTPVSSSGFSPNSSQTFVNNGGSGNAKPGYPQVNSSPQLVSHSSSGYPGGDQFSGTSHSQQMWTQQQHQEGVMWGERPPEEKDGGTQREFSQSDRVNLNTRIKTMILSKQQEENKEEKKEQTGHFLWYSHHHRGSDDGGPKRKPKQFQKFKNEKPSPSKINESEIPRCDCFRAKGLMPPEPGTYYTHLGCSNNLINLRHDLESRTGVTGSAIRIEKIRYTGKEGKTAQGCPIAKWIIRRSSLDEKYLIIVKHRPGHYCHSAFIVVCIVMWDSLHEPYADALYSLLSTKLNAFGLTTSRRCGSNEPKTCACQGLDPSSCGASFSFGCSWSMYYNGCKFTRSKIVRKFRLSLRSEEQLMEEHLQRLATFLGPIYKKLAPRSFRNQVLYESVATDCRLGLKEGRPWSGVTACLDFCAHSHKDAHNMVDGCTAVVTLTRHKKMERVKDEQLHVLPLYVVDDEFHKEGCIEVLNKYETEFRPSPGQPPRCKAKRKPSPSTPPQISSTLVYNSHFSKSFYQVDSARKQLFPDSYRHEIPRAEVSDFSNLPFFSSKLQVQSKLSDNSDCFKDASIGGVAIALEHGSVLFECARHELHATTALRTPNRQNPSRIALVFYQHRNLNRSRHGWEEYMRMKIEKMQELRPGEVMLRSPTLTAVSLTTPFPMSPCVLTGPFGGVRF